MSVLVKGMEMPKKGSWVTLRVFPDGQCFLYSWCGNDFDFMEHLTAVPVQTHGRLIDADALKDKWTHKDLDLFSQGWGWLCDLNQAPTVIPASKEGE